ARTANQTKVARPAGTSQQSRRQAGDVVRRIVVCNLTKRVVHCDRTAGCQTAGVLNDDRVLRSLLTSREKAEVRLRCGHVGTLPVSDRDFEATRSRAVDRLPADECRTDREERP